MNPVDEYLMEVGAATADEVLAEVLGSPEDAYARLVALEGAGKVSVRVVYEGKEVVERLWVWNE